MGKKFLTYGAVLIATYLVLAYGSNSGTLIDKSTAGAGTVIKAFQARG